MLNSAFEATAVLKDGTEIRFKCIGTPLLWEPSKWRLDLGIALDPLPNGLMNKDITDLCYSLTQELAFILERPVSRVQPDRLTLGF